MKTMKYILTVLLAAAPAALAAQDNGAARSGSVRLNQQEAGKAPRHPAGRFYSLVPRPLVKGL